MRLHRDSHQPIAFFCFVLILTAFSAGAAGADNHWNIGFGLGSPNVDSDADFDIRADVRAGYHFTDWFELEAQFISATGFLDATLDTWMLNGVFELRPPGGNFAPYALAGAGYARLSDYGFLTDVTTTESGTAFQAAFGVRYFFGEAKRVGAQVELSNLWENTDAVGFGRHLSLTAGMAWKLGGR